MERIWPRPRGPHLLRGLHLHIWLHSPRHHHLHLLLQDYRDHQVQGDISSITNVRSYSLASLILAPLRSFVVVC